jgi:addiction module HigA family antidote
MVKAKSTSIVTPGIALKKQLDLYNLSIFQLAEGIKISPSAARGIVTGKIRISVQTAQRLSKYFGKAPEYWISLQNAYDLAESSADSKNAAVLKSITKAVKVLAKAPARKTSAKATVKRTVKKAGPGRPRTKKV